MNIELLAREITIEQPEITDRFNIQSALLSRPIVKVQCAVDDIASQIVDLPPIQTYSGLLCVISQDSILDRIKRICRNHSIRKNSHQSVQEIVKQAMEWGLLQMELQGE